MEVDIRLGVCNNSQTESTGPENGWRFSPISYKPIIPLTTQKIREKAQRCWCRCGLGVRTKLMARASDGPASSADLGWRSKDLTGCSRTWNVGYWSGEGFRVNGNRTQSYPGAEHNVVSLVKVKVSGSSQGVLGHIWKRATENLGSYSK